MKFITYQEGNGAARVGVLHNNRVFDLVRYQDMLQVIAAGQAACDAASEATSRGQGIALDRVRLLTPIAQPPRIFCVGLNYADHAAETKATVAPVPTVFLKLSSCVIGPGDDVVLPSNSAEPDYEAELAFVIGKPGFRIAAADWQDHVFGYTICNDISARDVQKATTQWTLGKSFPTFAPIGPVIVSCDEIPDPHTLDIKLSINGEELQHSNTKELIFRIPQIIEHISSVTPLEVGDIVSTGTPAGVGMGRTPRRWLQPGEEMVVIIEKIGELRNRTKAEA